MRSFKPSTEVDKRGRPLCSAYFDEVWYSNTHLQGSRTADAWGHYLANAREPGFDPNPAFDSAWYAKRFMSKADKRTPLTHYVQQGRRQGASPSPWFDPDWYRKVHADVAESGVDPLRHYLEEGVAQLRSPGPYFDPVWYLSSQGDDESVKRNPLAHYRANAGRPGFEPNPLGAIPAEAGDATAVSALFDVEWYLDHYKDVRAAGVDPVWHYLEAGRFEGRRPSPFFDPIYYVKQAPEVSVEDALGHYVILGYREGFDPCPYFSTAWYSEEHLGADGDVSPLEHYLEKGAQLGLSPHPLYDDARYLESNPDVAEGVRNGRVVSGYHHFVGWGVDEIERGDFRRFSFPWGKYSLDFDLDAYRVDNPDVSRAIASGRVGGALDHLFTVGWREAMDGLRALYSARHQVRLLNNIAGRAAKSGGRYLCLFAHYDRDDLVDPYVVTALKSLRALDVDIVFITATADDKQLAKVKPLVSRILVKNEAGRDFGSWWLALKTLGLDCGQGYERVMFVNDSIYFPVRPLAPMFADMEVKGYNLYGLSDSHDLQNYHLQSFFLAFDAKASAAVFPEFMERFERNYVLAKWGQIREYELGLTKIAQEAGLSVGAYFSGDDVREDVIRDPRLKRWETLRGGLSHINPTHDLWDLMIGHYNWPGLKVELLRDNPRGANRLNQLPDLIGDGDVPYALIESHQKRMRSPAPLRVASPARAEAVEVDVRERVAGQGPDGRRLVLFAHYDPHGVVDDHVVHQLKALTRNDCAVAVITPSTRADELAKFRPYAKNIIVKSDAGRDFGSWDLGIREYGAAMEAYDSVIWMNDSTYFPLFDLKPMFDKMDGGSADFWGIVDSNNVTWHVMSWFWSFNRKIIKDGWFDWYVREHNAAYSKWAQIHNYEMRIPRMLRAAGYSTDSYVSSSRVSEHILRKTILHPRELAANATAADAYGRPRGTTDGTMLQHPKAGAARSGQFNMMHDFWQEIVVDLGCPAVKVELVRDNPLGIDLSSLLDVIGKHTDYDPDLIRRHMKRLKTTHLPSPAWADLGQSSARDL